MRNKIIFYTILVFTFVMVQVTILNFISISGVSPNILIILIVSISLLEGRTHGAAVGFSTGLCLDAVIGISLGFNSLLGMLLGFALGNINRRFFKENIFVMAICTFISTILYECAAIAGSYIYGLNISFLSAVKAVAFPEAVINSILGAILFFIIAQINKRWFYNESKNRY
ncbi:rod shape-determining protein MreD [Ruminiclostridium sufflavum DSM 19573]|uniref:Rod shape-determining protein MreD n=1 Tax=Ruminiclostridium sufflavum DSM 19573 TaxID=1121337 RepID=A0A318XJV9_9FIRM|nr:rod shape-determining protein MreD [Ruminiclostridium sufflavum]PYG87289.1 rod shape-determining protein MreD [Ruminiclostridium sufflavum DSM 19573]